jgi:26S proteasome regulatory subunit N5
MKEKLEFILYQMKLVLARKDFVRVQILSRKISSRHISEKGLEHLKVQFYLNMTKYYIHEKMIVDVAKSYKTIFDTLHAATEEQLPELQAIGITKDAAFENFVFYLLCSPYTDEKV